MIKVLIKFFLLLLPCLSIASNTNKLSILHAVWGEPADNSLTLGFLAYHYKKLKKKEKYFYPGIALSKSGFFIGGLKNTWDKGTLGLGVDRTLYKRSTASKNTYSIGYLLGMSFFGYCWFDLQCKKKNNIRMQPILAPYIDYMYLNKMGVQLGVLGTAISLAFKIKFR